MVNDSFLQIDDNCVTKLRQRQGETLPGCYYRSLDIVLCVCRRNESRLELRGGPVEAAVKHGVEKLGEPLRIGLLRRFIIGHRMVREEKRDHRPNAIDRDFGGGRRGEPGSAFFQKPVDRPVCFQILQHGEACRYRHRVA
jgi:hypothetical protein